MNYNPLFIKGPTEGRVYARMNDLWVVTSRSVKGELAALRLRSYSRLQRWIAHLSIPLMILTLGAVGEILLPCPWLTAWAGVAALIAGVPLYFLRQQEFAFLDSQPSDIFLLLIDGSLIVNGQKLDVPKNSKRFFEHRHFTPPDEDSSSFFELDLVIVDGVVESRHQLTSGCRALKHAKQLSSACNIELKRKKVAAG